MAIRELSVFFPFYNEAELAAQTIQKAYGVLASLNLERFEVVAVNDGSRDETGRILDRLKKQYPNLTVIHHVKNRGYGAALKSGLYGCRFEWIFFSDGDSQFDLNELKVFIAEAEINPNRPDLVIGYRQNRAEGFVRQFNTFLYGRLIRLLFSLTVKDIDCAFKLLRKTVIDTIAPLQSEGALISAELLLKAQRAGFVRIELPVKHFPDRAGGSTGANPKVILRMFCEIFKLRFP